MSLRLLLIPFVSIVLARPPLTPQPPAMPDTLRDFGALVTQLSEPAGFFDTDNLISNEASYLHATTRLARDGVSGGAYIGVGPDQNFSYITQVRPQIAFIIDIRRDNLLQHLWYKALFALSPTRADYLARLTGRPPPPASLRSANVPLPVIVAWIDSTAATPASTRAALDDVARIVRTVGVPLSPADLATITRIHRTFIDEALGLRFTSLGRAPRWYYPTLRDLLLERDRQGRMAGYLVTDDGYRYLRELQARHRVVPVVGNLAGPHALRAIGAWLRTRDIPVSAMYVSNVEDYLLRDGVFGNYARTVGTLPYRPSSVIIRSWFGGPGSHPESVDGYYSTQLLQRFPDFLTVAPTTRSYGELVRR